jgi:methylamine--corrinoid protein Co-methyltransferase
MEASHSAAGGRIARHASGLDAKICGEVVHAVAGMSREQANLLVTRLVRLYENDLPNNPAGKPFEEVYDVENVEPTPEWQGMYDEVRNELIGMGVPIGRLNK